MNISKQGNKWRIRQMHQGKKYSILLDHKPSKFEAMQLLSDMITQPATAAADMTFRMACDAYINAKANILSPSTLKEYTRTASALPAPFCDKYIAAITYLDVQKVVNDYAATLKPKTVANYAHFIMAVLKAQGVDIKAPQLPQRVKTAPYIPTVEDVQKVMEVLAGSEHEIIIMLCCYGLRRSEACALSLADLDGNKLTINKAMVKDKDKNWVIKTTKTTDSTRTIIIPDELANKIREQGYIYKYNPENVYKALQRAQDAAGVHRFQLHKLRHFYASFLHNRGYTDKQIQEMGGWRTNSILSTIYQHAMELDAAKNRAASDIGGLFS